MEKLGIEKFKKLIEERVANPRNYKGKTLILWDADYINSGLPWQIIKEVCIEHNLANQEKEGVWFKISDMTFLTDDYTSPEAMCDCEKGDMYGWKHKGILFNTGCCLKPEKEALKDFINTHTNKAGSLSENWAMVACVHPSMGFTPEDFCENCEIIELAPDVEEWGKYISARYDERVCQPVIEYVKEHGYQMDFSRWHSVIDALEDAMKKEDIEELRLMPKEVFNRAVMLLGGNHFDEFREILRDFRKSIIGE